MKKDPAKYKSTTGLDETKSDAYNGKLSYILKCISDDFNSTFGVRPFLIIQREWTDRDFSLVNCPIWTVFTTGLPFPLWICQKKCTTRT